VPRRFAAVIAALAAALTLIAVPASASSQVACGMSQRLTAQSSGGTWVVSRPNPFSLAGNPRLADRFCIQADGPGFRILANVPDPAGLMAYPFTGAGCAYDLCSRGTDLPRRVGREGHAVGSWTWGGTTRGFWNASWDLWFDRRDQVSTQDNGAELMIWQRTPPGYPYGQPQQKVFIGGRWMWFMHWTTGHAGLHWHYIQFRFTRTTHSVRGLRLWPFIHYAIRHRLIRWGWWLTSVHAGYELWSGGRGLSTTWFNVRA
jgi:hypothetical protein